MAGLISVFILFIFLLSGFLSQLVQEKEVEKCIKCGIWAATEIIQRPGCSYDQDLVYQE